MVGSTSRKDGETFLKKLCLICGEGYLTDLQSFNTIIIADQEVTVPLEYSICDACGSEQGSPDQLKRNKQVVIYLRKKFENV